MARIALAFAALMLWGAAALGGPAEEGRVAAAGWSPWAVSQAGNTLVVVLSNLKVSERIFRAVLLTGICFQVRAGTIALEGIAEIRVLNLHRGQGFVFAGGAVDCRLVSLRPDARRFHLREWTRVYRISA